MSNGGTKSILLVQAHIIQWREAGADEETMIKNWKKAKDHLEELYKKYEKPIVFAEIGCRSARGCATMPWDFSHTELPFDEEEQARFYSSVMKVFWDEPWFSGFFWWDWSTKLYPNRRS